MQCKDLCSLMYKCACNYVLICHVVQDNIVLIGHSAGAHLCTLTTLFLLEGVESLFIEPLTQTEIINSIKGIIGKHLVLFFFFFMALCLRRILVNSNYIRTTILLGRNIERHFTNRTPCLLLDHTKHTRPVFILHCRIEWRVRYNGPL